MITNIKVMLKSTYNILLFIIVLNMTYIALVLCKLQNYHIIYYLRLMCVMSYNLKLFFFRPRIAVIHFCFMN